jgi:hypothetical protein
MSDKTMVAGLCILGKEHRARHLEINPSRYILQYSRLLFSLTEWAVHLIAVQFQAFVSRRQTGNSKFADVSALQALAFVCR